MKKSTWRWIIIALIVFASCCVLAAAALLGYQLLNKPAAAASLRVNFETPTQGGELPVGEMAIVHIIARDPQKVERVEFWANGSLVESRNSPLEGGINPFALVVGWVPPETGAVTLIARAYSHAGEEATGEIRVTVVQAAAQEVADRDGDGYPDDDDFCPDAAGLEPDGCPASFPDDDGDSVEDALDECPGEPGSVLAEGCPDMDEDGVPDEVDECPEYRGAADSVGGVGCPVPPGTPDDRDGDGIPDVDDGCPDDPGPAESGGCPGTAVVPPGGGGDGGGLPVLDRDADGLNDAEDACPDEAGPMENRGCPAGAADRDADGFPDIVDFCPEDAGAEADGCPPPEAGGSGDEGAGLLEGLILHAYRLDFVEFQALTFQVNQPYEEVNCYASLTDDPPALYGPFNFEGGQSWDITEYMGSMRVGVRSGDALPVLVECFAYSGPPGHPEYHFIGRYQAGHPDSDWDGHVITAVVEPADNPVGSAEADTEGFTATYRICAGSCDDSSLPAPVLSMVSFAGDQFLAWNWPGEDGTIDAYKLYVNGSLIRWFEPDVQVDRINEYDPACGEAVTFQLSAASGDLESPLSNAVVWEGSSCGRRVRVTFDRYRTYGLRDGLRGDTVGPIFGNFWAAGATEERLVFNGSSFPYGFVINASGSTRVMSIFNAINTAEENGMCGGLFCNDFSAPEVNYVEVEVAPGTDLSIGAGLYDEDWTDIDHIFNDQVTIPYDEIAPGRYVIIRGAVELVYYLEISDIEGSDGAGDGAAAPPDLRITAVEINEASGQVRSWVVNIGGVLEGQDVRLEYHDSDDDSLIDSTDYTALTLASGEGRWLQSGRTDIPAHGVRVVIDPDNRVEESNEDNNTYTTSMLVQVSLEQIFNDSFCESFTTRYAEYAYTYSVGYGMDVDHITWVAPYLRYPSSGYSIDDRYQEEEENYDWPAAEDNRFRVQVPVPQGNNIYVYMTGWEEDPGSFDDDQGLIFTTFNEEEYRTADHLERSLHSEGEGTEVCRDVEVERGGDDGYTAWFVITRLE